MTKNVITAGPSEDGELLDGTIESVSFVVEHAQPSLNGNVNDAYDN